MQGHLKGHSRLPGFSFPGKAFRPGQVDVTDTGVPVPARLFPQLTYDCSMAVAGNHSVRQQSGITPGLTRRPARLM